MKKYKITKSFTFEGKRYYVHADSEKEAIQKMTRRQIELEQGQVTYDGSMLLSQWAEIALATYKADVSEKTLEDIRIRMNKHVLAELGKFPIGKIKPVMCQNFINGKKGFSQEYINKIYQDLYFLFEKAKQNHMVSENPAEFIVRPKGYTTHRRALTANERTHLFKVCADNPRFLPFLVMLRCGCRPAEALAIKHGDISVKEGIPYLHIRGTKTVNSDRTVPMPFDLFTSLSKGSPFEYVFLSANGQPYTRSGYQSLVKALKRAMNISMGGRVYRNKLVPPYPLAEDFVPYCLRHTYCTDLQKAGVDVRTAQKLMGHADISTTANIYTHQDEETLKAAAIQLGCNSGCNTFMSKNG
ncbi:MAG: tyrosine-type recombinase/integrase family protein [Eubacterium sp.]|nr:tyrosine-type recombinase/integrase family protein [Eubacterium sp.]